MQFVFVNVISVALFFAFAGTVLLAEEKPEAILAAAKKLSGSSRDSVHVYDITATIGVDGKATIDSKLVEKEPC